MPWENSSAAGIAVAVAVLAHPGWGGEGEFEGAKPPQYLQGGFGGGPPPTRFNWHGSAIGFQHLVISFCFCRLVISQHSVIGFVF